MAFYTYNSNFFTPQNNIIYAAANNTPKDFKKLAEIYRSLDYYLEDLTDTDAISNATAGATSITTNDYGYILNRIYNQVSGSGLYSKAANDSDLTTTQRNAMNNIINRGTVGNKPIPYLSDYFIVLDFWGSLISNKQSMVRIGGWDDGDNDDNSKIPPTWKENCSFTESGFTEAGSMETSNNDWNHWHFSTTVYTQRVNKYVLIKCKGEWTYGQYGHPANNGSYGFQCDLYFSFVDQAGNRCNFSPSSYVTTRWKSFSTNINPGGGNEITSNSPAYYYIAYKDTKTSAHNWRIHFYGHHEEEGSLTDVGAKAHRYIDVSIPAMSVST